ncbi:MAG: ribose-phosphate diphosphokinase [Candidatus Pacearchaeota archaeon]
MEKGLDREVMLLADKHSDGWNFAREIQNYLKKEKDFDMPLNEVQINKFRSGEIDMHVPENLRQRNVYFVQDSNKNPQDWWIELMLMGDLLNNSSTNNSNFVLPNLLYGRKDRKDKPRVPISSRVLANSIIPYMDRLLTVDMHAEQIQGSYPAKIPIDSLQSFPYVVDYLRDNYYKGLENLVVVSPDAGGADRAKTFLEKLKNANKKDSESHNYSFAIMDKNRYEAGKVGEMDLIGDVNNKNVLVVDDIIDSGGTQSKAADVLKENGANKVFCYGTHGIFTKGTEDLYNKFDAVITSNTHYQNNTNVDVVDLSPLFGEAIYRNHTGESISELFRNE